MGWDNEITKKLGNDGPGLGLSPYPSANNGATVSKKQKYPWLDEYCRTKPGCVKDFQAEWEATRYMIGGKMFALQGDDKQKNAIITLKIEPSYGALLRQDYPADITPGYYMNKLHWNSVRLDGSVPEKLLKEMIDESYEAILHSLTKKLQKELLGQS